MLVFKEVDYKLAKQLVLENHYSHKWNTAFGKVNIGVFKKQDLNTCLGVACFGNLMNTKSHHNINKDFCLVNVVELNRLWLDDCLGKNAETMMLGACWKILRNDYPEIKAVQSFADGRLGVGTIYKAANFHYFGYSKTLFYENTINGEVRHRVPMENTKRPDGFIKLNYQYSLGVLKPFYVKTFKYIYPLYKNTKIELTELPYPEYEKGLQYADKYVHNYRMFFRAFILATILGYTKESQQLKSYIEKYYSVQQIKENMQEAFLSPAVIEVVKQRKVFDKYLELKESEVENG